MGVSPNIGVHGKAAHLHLEKLWIRDVTITTGLVDTFSISQLMRLISSGRLDPSLFATHRFELGDTMAAYDVFADAANSGALKVVLQGASERSSSATAAERSADPRIRARPLANPCFTTANRRVYPVAQTNAGG